MTVSDVWRPTAADQIQAQAGYLQYAIGVTMLARPESFSDALGGANIDSDHLEAIVVHAEDLMLAGLQDTIRYTNNPETRRLADLETRHATTVPLLREMLDDVYEDAADQLHDLSPDFSRLRPLPVLNETIFRFVCHSRRDKILTTRLMGGFMPSRNAARVVDGRTLSRTDQESD